MGYNSWYDVLQDVSEVHMVATAQAMKDRVSHNCALFRLVVEVSYRCRKITTQPCAPCLARGLLEQGFIDAGYNIGAMDDGWQTGRQPNGTIIPDPARFPNGLRGFADAMSSFNLIAGVYTDRGTKTCGGHPGSEGFEAVDADAYVANGIRYLKEDSCNAPADHATAFDQYATMRDALANASAKYKAPEVFFSLCGWNGWYAPVGSALGNSWRIGPDDTDWTNLLRNVDIVATVADYAGPGGWNDPCLLLGETVGGKQQITPVQSVTQFYLWAVMPAPLLISQSVINMSDARVALYTNKEVIAINQDPLGKPGHRLQGGPLASSTSTPPALLSGCGSASAGVWTMPATGLTAGYLQLNSSDMCLNVDNCGTAVIGYECLTSGGTCCGDSCYENLQWVFDGPPQSALIRSKLGSNQCITATGMGQPAELAPCSSSDNQLWDVTGLSNGASGSISLAASKATSCLTLEAASSSTNVWGRRLADGDWAFAFVNVGANTTSITCDAACLAETGWEADTVLLVRDAGNNTDLANTTVTAGLGPVTLDADSGAIWRVTPKLD
jgi:alpha-galactosidase